MIAQYDIVDDDFLLLQAELAKFYNIDIPYFNPFDEESKRDNIPIKIPRVAVSYGDMTTNIIEEHNLTVLPRIIMEKIKQYTDENLKIVNCWATDMRQGSEGLLHHHLPTKISGVYYHAIDKSDSKIEFLINNELVAFDSKVGKLMIWPAGTLHRIPLKTTATKRQSISFNLIKG